MEHFDILIIGGGITGSGCLLEASRRELNCVLVEKGDFASGTTAASSRLIHGGIRYLENFHLRLVAEGLSERFWIGQRFPNLVKPLAIHIPIYGWGKRSPITAAIGVRLYDLLSGKKKIYKSSVHSGRSARALLPQIERDRLSGMFVFYDYQIIMPERLVLENITAAKKLGAASRNYTAVTRIEENGGEYRADIKNTLTGETSTITASTIVNATGAWTDELRRLAGLTGSLIRPTRGVHLETVRLSDKALMVESAKDGRMLYILPFMQHNLIGTTDDYYQGDPDNALPHEEDTIYLVESTNKILRGKRLEKKDVYSAFCGLRPLLNTTGKDESSIPRSHRITAEGRFNNFITITGGKLTTFRKMAEQTINRAIKASRKQKTVSPRPVEYPCGNLAHVDGCEYIEHLKSEYGITAKTAGTLYTLHGMNTDSVLQFAARESSLLTPFYEYTAEIPAQIVYAFEHESANTLEDVLLRRMLIGKSPRKGLDIPEAITAVLTGHLGKSRSEALDMFESARESIMRRFRMNI